jgi:methylenetetrahydrofolate reductase (NADPH)
MNLGQSIVDKLIVNQPLTSFEFFPAKTEEGARQIIKTALAIKETHPDFVSITYGAGGGTRQRTLEYGELLHELFNFEVMPHLTCIGHSRDELREILTRIERNGFRNIMTLRGDPPKDDPSYRPHPDGFRYASELVGFIREEFPYFCLGVAGYPEKHPEAPSMEIDLANLRNKVNQGASFITTQLFYNNEDYFNFVASCRNLGISCPIIPGILPVLSLEQLQRFCGFCGAKIPLALEAQLVNARGDVFAEEAIGIEWAYHQVRELLERGVPGVHFYILNRAHSVVEVINQLKRDGLFNKRYALASSSAG